MKITFNCEMDPTEVIEQAINGISLSGLGMNGDSEYDITDSDVEWDGANITINLTIERTEGMNASRDEVIEAIADELEAVEGLAILDNS